MKKLATITVFILSASCADGQALRGAFLVDGSLSSAQSSTVFKNGTSTDTNKLSTWMFNTSTGYFFVNRWCVGISTVYEHQSTNFQNSSKSGYHSLGIGPFVRYYHPFGKGFYGIANAGYAWTSGKGQSLQIDNNGTTWIYNPPITVASLVLGIGMTYFVKENIGISFMANLTDQINDYQDQSLTYGTYNVSASLGFQLYFLRKK